MAEHLTLLDNQPMPQVIPCDNQITTENTACQLKQHPTIPCFPKASYSALKK